MPEATIYKATYSGVPVYEFLCKSIACMRRRSDGWLNATQILKVAGFDKPQRTRILEREVQRGVHEKVQGGYGKYQGTWVPLERGKEIAALYKVEELLEPIMNFRPSTESPPLAPKHVTAASTKPRPTKAARAAAQPKKQPTPPVVQRNNVSEDDRGFEIEEQELSDMEPLDSSITASSPPRPQEIPFLDENNNFERSGNIRKRKREPIVEDNSVLMEQRRRVAYSDELLDYFMTNENGLPSFLENPPPDFDVNEIIDDEGHTAFHWAAAMGDLTVVELLLKAGADIRLANKRGETPLMRAVLFTNNYDRKSFPRLVTILRSTIELVDSFDSTVFHHIAATTSSRNKLLAAKYYCNVILLKLSESEPQGEIGHLLDNKDMDGNTALTIAARNSARKLVQMMLAYHASPDILNNEGRTADEYILIYERNRRAATHPHPPSSSPIQPLDAQTQFPFRGQQPSQGVASAGLAKFPGGHSGQHVSEAALQTNQKSIPLMAEKLEALASAFDSELRDKEEDLSQARGLHDTMQKEVESCRIQFAELSASRGADGGLANSLSATQATAEAESLNLKQVIERNQYFELEQTVREEEMKIAKKPVQTNGDKELRDQFDAARQLIKAQYGRNQLVEKIMELYAQAGLGTKINDYRRLIAAALKMDDDVEPLIPEILKSLECASSPEATLQLDD